jgi:glycosyltransferase involved in cell wall biosynthesis
MNIWMINHYAIPPSEAGGTRHFSHARELIRRGHRVEIIAAKSQSLSRGESCDKPAKNWERELVEGEVPFNWIASPSYKGNSLGRIWNMLVFAQRVWSGSWSSGLPKPDVIIGSSPHPFAAFAGERLAAKYSVPFVLEVRDLWPNALVQVSGHSPHHPFVKLVGWLERYLYARASRIIMFSPSGAERVAETGNDPSKVTWVPNGIDLRMLPQPSPPSNHKCFTVLYLGAHGVANDLDSIVDAVAIICKSGFGSRIKFRFVGSGTEKSRLVARAAGEGIRNIEFDDPIPKSQVSRVLAGC